MGICDILSGEQNITKDTRDFMEYVMGLVTNKVLLSAVAAWFVAQGSKIILDVMKGTFTFKRLSGGGGMPSVCQSHPECAFGNRHRADDGDGNCLWHRRV